MVVTEYSMILLESVETFQKQFGMENTLQKI